MCIGGAKNIFEESRPMFFITGLVGLRPPRICKKAFPGYIYVALMLIAYYLLSLFVLNDNLDYFDAMGQYTKAARTREFQAFNNIVFMTIMMISCVFGNSKLRQLYIELNVVDEKMKLLNVRFDYTRSMKREAMHIGRVIIATIMFNLMEYFPQVGPDYDRFYDLLWIVNTLPQFVNSLVIASYVIVIFKIDRRFDAVNELIPNLVILDKNVISTLESEMNNRNEINKLRLLNRIHEKLFNAATMLNETHGLALLASFIVYFLTSCAHLRVVTLTFGSVNDTIDFAVEFLWTFFYLGKYVYVINACHNLTLRAKLSGRLLREKCTDADHQPLKNETESMARRVDSRVLQLTACNFFDIDYPTLKKVVVVLGAYVFFVYQFSTNSPRNFLEAAKKK